MKKLLFVLAFCGWLWGAEENPYKIAAAPDGGVILADPLRQLVRIIYRDDTEITVRNNFDQPQAAVRDRDGNLYVLDTGAQRLWKFVYKNGFQPAGSLGGWRYPRDLALSPDHKWLYVLDSGSNKIT
ncbi:MAG: hypothetical protein LBD99_06810, partial [Candidatus Margulisbacteria bacterium]|nr:hypothetical protein [Candidatus Margulisiibacteriota bacterium]